MEAARDDDPELADLREVIGLWHAALGPDGYTVRDVVTQIGCKEESKMGEPTEYRFPDLRDALLRLFGERGEVNTNRMGRWLLSREGRIVGGLRIKRGVSEAHGGVVRWTVAMPPAKRSTPWHAEGL
jgi:putative DNA primase/helicase